MKFFKLISGYTEILSKVLVVGEIIEICGRKWNSFFLVNMLVHLCYFSNIDGGIPTLLISPALHNAYQWAKPDCERCGTLYGTAQTDIVI